MFKNYEEHYGNFVINNFIKFLDVELAKNDPTIYVYVGNEKENYDDLADNIKTIYDKNIIRGIKIKYHNNVIEVDENLHGPYSGGCDVCFLW